MASIQVLLSIATIIVSMVLGFVFFYFLSPLSREDKKKHIEEMISLSINFVIFVWVGKVMLNFSIFIRDPMAILAYPSDSSAFYIAFFLLCIQIIYKVRRHSFAIRPLLNSFIPVFLMANFIYEFIQMVWQDSQYAWASMTLLVILLILYLALFERFPQRVMYIIVLGWTFGQFILAYVLPFTTMFNYIMEPWFLSILFIVGLFFFIFHERKRVS